MHLVMMVRPDICFAVHYLAEYMHNPINNLWTVRQHILRHAKRTESLGKVYHRDDEKRLQVFSDADCRHKKPNQKSISSYLFTHSGGAIPRRSKQQSTVAPSSKEPEHISLAACMKEISWIQKFIRIFEKDFPRKELDMMFKIYI